MGQNAAAYRLPPVVISLVEMMRYMIRRGGGRGTEMPCSA
jgi:hypothetical protein